MNPPTFPSSYPWIRLHFLLGVPNSAYIFPCCLWIVFNALSCQFVCPQWLASIFLSVPWIHQYSTKCSVNPLYSAKGFLNPHIFRQVFPESTFIPSSVPWIHLYSTKYSSISPFPESIYFHQVHVQWIHLYSANCSLNLCTYISQSVPRIHLFSTKCMFRESTFILFPESNVHIFLNPPIFRQYASMIW